MERPPYLRLHFGPTSERQISTKSIVDTIRTQLNGKIDLSGCRLPPIRALAHQLGVSKNTIQIAYDELKILGLIEGRDRAGLYVATREKSLPFSEVIKKVGSPKLKTYPAHPNTLEHSPDEIQLSTVFLDPDILPREKISECYRSVLKNPGLRTHYSSQGLLPLREIIAKRLRDRGMDADARHVVITAGSQPAIDITTRSLQTKIVGTEDPFYFGGKVLMELNGLQTFGLPVDPFVGIDKVIWEQQIRKYRPGLLYLTTNFQNPNGYSYTSEELAHIIEWAHEFGFGLLEDDWGSEMLSYSEFRPGLRALGGKDVLYINSYTKKLLPSLRLGYILGSEKTIDNLVMAKRVSCLGTPALNEYALFEFIDRGHYDTHLKNVQQILDQRYNNCLNLLRELMPPEIKWTTPGGGPILWLEFPKRVSIEQIIQNLKNKKIHLIPTQKTFFKTPHNHGVKIGYAFLKEHQMQKALELLAVELVNELKK